MATDPKLEGLRAVLGSSWSELWSDDHHLITWQNARPDETSDYAIGFRCVAAVGAIGHHSFSADFLLATACWRSRVSASIQD